MQHDTGCNIFKIDTVLIFQNDSGAMIENQNNPNGNNSQHENTPNGKNSESNEII